MSTLERQVFLPRNRNGCLATQAITEKETGCAGGKGQGQGAGEHLGPQELTDGPAICPGTLGAVLGAVTI